MPKSLKYPAMKFASWRVMLVLACLMVVLDTVISLELYRVVAYQGVLFIRLAHLLMTLVVIVYILTTRNHLQSSMLILLTGMLYLPLYLIVFLHYYKIPLEVQSLTPFNAIKLHFLIIPSLRLGSYWVNLFYIFVLAIDMCLIWNLGELDRQSAYALIGEPYLSMIFLVASIGLVFSRYLDDKYVSNTIAHTSTNELANQTLRTFSSIRDLANTPLQTLKILNAKMTRNHPDEKEILETVDRNLDRVIKINRTLSTLGTGPRKAHQRLMTDAEIIEWIEEMNRNHFN